MNDQRMVKILAPAKVNLGLEILSRRADGYHELRSVLSMVDITDELTFRIAPELESSRIDGVPGVTPSDNLIMKAITLFNERASTATAVHVRAIKRIPVPSGLGGASSNAAATLLAMNHLHDDPLTDDALDDLAKNLGSDVPFFLGTPTASVSGTGTTLSPLPNPTGWLLIVVPQVDLIAKTEKLYSALSPEDSSSGERVRSVAKHLNSNRQIPPELLSNAFERPLLTLMPYVEKIVRVMGKAGCQHVALSGAGPAHYSIFEREADARAVKQRLQPLLGSHDYMGAAPFRHTPLTVEIG